LAGIPFEVAVALGVARRELVTAGRFEKRLFRIEEVGFDDE
jgi:hypothetical protein